MARAMKGFGYGDFVALTSRLDGDVERMSPDARRRHFERRLQLLEAQILSLSNRLGVDVVPYPDELSWSQAPLDEKRWVSLVSLDYLMAAREALLEALNAL